MIDVTLAYVKSVLDQYLISKFNMDSGSVILNNITDQQGLPPNSNHNKLVVTLINLEYETNKPYYGNTGRVGDNINRIYPAVFFNLDILISANFDDYGESLKFLTAAIEFFQENLVLNRSNNPNLPLGVDAIKFEIENSQYHKTHNLWTALGAKYLPSIIYKIRQVNVQSGQIKRSDSQINAVSAEVNP